MPKILSRCRITASGDAYLLILETDGGESFEVTASFEQLDLIAEEIDRRLDADEEEILSLPDAGD